MKQFALGIDLGTTCVKIALIDSKQKILYEKEKPHRANNPKCSTNWNEQNPIEILRVLRDLLEEMASKNVEELSNISGIGISGQQHGVVLWQSDSLSTNFENCNCSQLITWMDERCDKQFLSKLPTWINGDGKVKPVATGYGMATLAWLKEHGQLDPNWDRAGTVMDFLAAYLTQNKSGISICTQNSESWGFSDADACSWTVAEQHCEIFPMHLLPRIAPPGTVIGHTSAGRFVAAGFPAGIPVLVPIGDLQATLLPILHSGEAALHIGTASQLVFLIKNAINDPSDEASNSDAAMPPLDRVRQDPYFSKENTLLVGASLNGGNTLDCFVRQIADWSRQLFAHPTEQEERQAGDNIYATMSRLFQSNDNEHEQSALPPPPSPFSVQPTFFGERYEPENGASVQGWRPDITLDTFIRSIARGIVRNLAQLMPQTFLLAHGCTRLYLVGKARQRLFVAEAGLQFPNLEVYPWEDAVSAAYGAALYALKFIR